MLDIFTFTTTDHTMTETDEASAIAAAQAGDESAQMDLIRAYGPALRSAVSRFKSGLGDGQVSRSNEAGTPASSLDDLQSAALVAFLEVIQTHDPALNPRLAGRVVAHLADSLAVQFSKEAHFAIPKRTLTRFHGVLKAAEGDISTALDLIADYGMGRDTFLAVLAAVQSGSVEGLTSQGEEAGSREPVASPVYSPAPVLDVEDRILVDMAFAAVADDEARIVELAYGFTEYDPIPDAEIGHRLGLTRPTVQRKRASALGSMRKAIGVTHA